jgi:class 3 adenylate cyclase
MDDVRAVLDAVGIDKAALLGISEGGSLATIFAALNPERTRALVLYGAFARFTSWMPTPQALSDLFDYIDTAWGSGESLPMFAPTMTDNPRFKQWWGRFERLGGSPGAVKTLMRMNSRIDITGILPSVRVPTLVLHRKDDVTVDVGGGRLLAERIPGARYVELSGTDHLPMVGENSDRILDEISHFLTGHGRPVATERVLTTVLFADIVDSTGVAAQIGDSRWKDLLEQHYQNVRSEVERFRGREIDTSGDGFFAVFDGPARAVRCACAIRDAASALGIAIRAGLHTGECEVIGEKFGGISVHIGARVMHAAEAHEVLVSSTVKDLVGGSGLHFSEHGTHALKGVPGEWRLFRVASLEEDPAANLR